MMADGTSSGVPQKLAAAKKKYKAYLKEKELKKNNNTLDNIQTTPIVLETQNTSQTNLVDFNEPTKILDVGTSNQNDTVLPNYFGNNPVSSTVSSFFDYLTNENSNQVNVQNENVESQIQTQSETGSLDVDFISSYIPTENVEFSTTVTQNVAQLVSNHESFSRFENDTKGDLLEKSSIEGLRQISDDIEHLIGNDCLASTTANNVGRLEVRNQELTRLLEQKSLKCEQLEVLLKQSEEKCEKLQAEKLENNSLSNQEHTNEISRLQDEIQRHIFTIGVLVAEKTELSASLSQHQISLKNEATECSEVKNRLKLSRGRVSELERDINVFQQEMKNIQASQNDLKMQCSTYEKKCEELKRQNIELMQDLMESQEKLKMNAEQFLTLQAQNQELKSDLSLANIKIEQLTYGKENEIVDETQKFGVEKLSLEKKVVQLNQALEALTKEKQEISAHCQQYVEQLNLQLTKQSVRVDQLLKENDHLKNQEQNRIKHLSDLERQLQTLQNDHFSYSSQKNSGGIKRELEAAQELVRNLNAEKIELNENFTRVGNENSLLLKELEGARDSISVLESYLEQAKSNRPDNAQLLAAMESDKVAASRAMAQNKDLKNQMEGMQEVMMKVNNDNLELTEKLRYEQLTSKDLMEKLRKTEISLQTLAEAIEVKDTELSHVRDTVVQLQKHHEQSHAEHKHSHAEHEYSQAEHECAHEEHKHAHNTADLDKLKSELEESKKQIQALNEEINRLKTLSIENTNDSSSKNVEHKEGDNNLLSNHTPKNLNLENQVSVNNVSKNLEENNALDKTVAMQHLEKKFLRTMEEIARLTDEKQRLEHLVLQLQSETETIGEYVALYQQQRSLLKQKTIEKDQQLQQLENDRQNIKSNILKLNLLVNKLVAEKGVVTKELFEHQQSLNSDELCVEHAKVQEEIQKITTGKLDLPESSENSNSNTEIAEEIIHLLTEIKSSNLVKTSETIHHCAWCSGQLLVV